MSCTENVAVFIRHGDYQQQLDTPSALQPFPLSPLGEQQAQSVATTLEAFCHTHGLQVSPHIHSSCLLRAWQTADVIAKRLDSSLVSSLPLASSLTPTAPRKAKSLHVQESQALCERSMGSLANLNAAAIEDILRNDPRYPMPPKHWKSDSYYALPYPDAESLMQAGQRVANYIDEVMCGLPKHAGFLQIFVGHGAAFRHAACHKHMLDFEDIARLSMFHAKPIFFNVTKDYWQHQAGDWKIRTPSSTHTD